MFKLIVVIDNDDAVIKSCVTSSLLFPSFVLKNNKVICLMLTYNNPQISLCSLSSGGWLAVSICFSLVQVDCAVHSMTDALFAH